MALHSATSFVKFCYIIAPSGHRPAKPCFLWRVGHSFVQDIIKPALNAGQIVISDRYLLATIVYQGYAGGLDVELLWQAGRLSTGGVEPDVTFVLDLPLELAKQRRGRPADRMESRGIAYDERVRCGFLTEVARQPGKLRRIDASGSVDEVQAALRRELSQFEEIREVPA